MEFTGERMVLGHSDPDLETEHLDRYRFAEQFVKDKTVLDAACGTGYGTAILAETADKVVGIDISKDAIEYAQKLYNANNISYEYGTVTELPFADRTFDVVVSFETLEHIDKEAQKLFVQEVLRVLKSDGLLIISTPNPEVYDKRGKNEFHVAELTLSEYRSLLEPCFDSIRFFAQKWEICSAIIGADPGKVVSCSGLDIEKAEYVIALCSNKDIPETIGGISVKSDDRLSKLMKWAIENDIRNTENNEHILELDKTVERLEEQAKETVRQMSEKDDCIRNQFFEIESKNKTIFDLAKNEQILVQSIAEKEKSIKEQQKTIDRQNESIAALTKDVQNKNDSIALLNQSDQILKQKIAEKTRNEENLQTELDNIHNSKGWKLLLIIWRIRIILAPPESMRAFILRCIWLTFRHPILLLKKVSFKRIVNMFRSLRNEGTVKTSIHIKETVLGKKQAETVNQPLSEMDVSLFALPESEIDNERFLPLSVPYCSNPEVSIVIPVFNQFRYTYLCIKSILENTENISYEIIVADDCSDDLTAEIDEIINGVVTIHNSENLRFLLNCNNAAKNARGRYILFLNNDTQVQKNWLAPLVELIGSADDIGMVGSKLIYPDGHLQEAGGILWKDGSAWNYGNGADPALPEYNYVKEVDYISGASIMIRRSLWELIGGFDERFFPAYCEDSDLAFEVRRHGYRVMYQPESVVVHFEGVTNGKDISAGQKAYQVKNQKKFYEKWKDILEQEHNPNGLNPFLARERGIGKKVLLMVDHYVPQYDKDAGSRTVFQYIKLFSEQGYHIKFIGDNFYPHQPYTSVLQQLGVEVLYGPYYADHWKDWLEINGKSIQYAFLNRPHIAVNYIDELRKDSGAKIVYYGHDLHFLRERREYELTKDPERLKQSEDWRIKELSLMRKVDMAYYPSQVEVDEIHRLDAHIKVKAIPAYLFDNIEKPKYDPDLRTDLMFIGGFAHKPNVDAVKWLVSEILPELEKQLPEVVIYIIGSNPPDEIKALERKNLKIVGFVTDIELEQFYSSCRLSVVPLRYGAGIKGKVVEAMRYGMPVVTTSIGAEGLADAEQYLAEADDPVDFARMIADLYHNKEELIRMSNDAFNYVHEYYSSENAMRIISEEFDMEKK